MTSLNTVTASDIGVLVAKDVNHDVITVIVTDEFGQTTVGTARRDPSDRPSDEIGVRMAMGRALRDLGRAYLHEANSEVRRQATYREHEKKLLAERKKQAVRRRVKVKTAPGA